MNKTALMEMLRSHAFSGDVGSRECLDENRCSRLVDGQLSDEEREAIVHHLADCRNCLDRVVGLVELQCHDGDAILPDLVAAALALDPEERPVQASSQHQWQTKLAVAASFILVVGALVWQYEGSLYLQSMDDFTQPAIEERAEVRIGAHDQERFNIISPTGDSSIDPKDFRLQWSSVDRSVFYRVQLLSDDGDVVWEGRTENTNVHLPQDLQLDSAGGYFLWVKAYLADGKTIKSTVVFIRIKENGQ